jgi:predicted DsbA family dithiol-disulfide isomerase
MKKVNLDLYSDFICPWCYIAKKRLASIKEQLKHELILDIDLKPFLLYPDMPAKGLSKSHFANKSKPGMGQALKIEAATEEIELNYKLINQIPYSKQAHQLISITPPDQRIPLATHIFFSYFEKGMDIGSKEVLYRVANEIGLDQIMLSEFMNADHGNPNIDQQIIESKQATGVVPAIKLNQLILLPGLQPKEVWINYIRRAAKMSSAH